LEILFKEKRYERGSISVEQFYEYFKNLSQEKNITFDENSKQFFSENLIADNPIFQELDAVVKSSEVYRAIKDLKRGKATSSDEIINEYLIEGSDILTSHLVDIFINLIRYSPVALFLLPGWVDEVIIPLLIPKC
jgi:hypothetical protein